MRASVPGATGWQNVADGGKSAAERAEARRPSRHARASRGGLNTGREHGRGPVVAMAAVVLVVAVVGKAVNVFGVAFIY